ncbi:MAG: M48 family metallopeptidase [Acidobacteria bacterium]|nr:M48 family metallopeptidase [Acidobacteriota bacterium]
MSARKVTGWVVLALLTLQTACGGLLAGAGLGRSLETRPRTGFNLFSPEQDIELGEASAEEIRRQLVVVRDERAEAYVQRLGERLAAQAPGYRFPYKFVVVASPEVNAFALPGGYVFVNEGAIEAARSEGELAGVLAHEIAHVSLRHGTTQASRAYLAKTGLNVLSALSVALQGDVGRVAAVVGLAGADKFFLESNRDAEAQADAEGARLMAAAGYDPRDMAEFFERLYAHGGERAREETGDHPDPASRVAAIGRIVAELKHAPARPHESEEFRRVRSRLSVR